MADIGGGGDEYSDGDLDALPAAAFEELEQNAFTSTQHRYQAGPVGQRQLLVDKQRQKYNSVKTGKGNAFEEQAQGKAPPSSDYGDFDDEIFEIPNPQYAFSPAKPVPVRYERINHGESTQREQHRLQRYRVGAPEHEPRIQGFTPRPPPAAVGPPVERVAKHVASDDEDMLDVPESAVALRGDEQEPGKQSALELQVQQLLQERERLQQEVKEAKELAFAKAGEISIVRANQIKAQREQEKRIVELQQKHAAVVQQQIAEINAIKAQAEKIETENKFLQQDLTEDSRRIKELQRGSTTLPTGRFKKPSLPIRAGPSTPKKARTSLGDGFDDDDIPVPSPPLSQRIGKVAAPKTATPKAGAKRKRTTVENSPSQPLELQEDDGLMPDAIDLEERVPKQPAKAVVPTLLRPEGKDLQFFQSVINHKVSGQSKRTLELLADYAFPSDPVNKVSTLLLDQLSSVRSSTEGRTFKGQLIEAIAIMWSRCMDEEYHTPIPFLLDMVKFIVIRGGRETASDIIDSLVPLIGMTSDVNIIYRYKKNNKSTVPDDGTFSQPSPSINTTLCLELLLTILTPCSIYPDDVARFWRVMRYDSILMLLRPFQPLADIHLILRLLCHSIRPDSFAMLLDPQNKKTEIEALVLDQLTILLITPFKPPEDGRPTPTESDICTLHLQILGVISRLTEKRYCAELFARHPMAIGRLVRLMNESLTTAYTRPPSFALHIELVNQATLLLYHFRSRYPNIVDIQEKLRVHPGGQYKWLIVLSRLAFSEGVWLDEGVEEDVVEAAREMLEDTVSPEEGEQLWAAFHVQGRRKPGTGKEKEVREVEDEEMADAG